MALTRRDIERLIADRIEESATLEYKSAGALGRGDREKKEITKDVAAFANAAGGMILYGIAEHRAQDVRHLPERIDPVNQQEFSREWLDQLIGRIQPRIDGVTISPIHVGPSANDYVYAVEIPEGETAHQSLDGRYYRRRNFEVTPMDDREIRDVMNRHKHPVVTANIRIFLPPQHRHDGRLVVRLTNTSTVLARYYRVLAHIPVKLSNGFYIQFEDATLYNDEAGQSYWSVVFQNGSKGPLFPDSHILLDSDFRYVPKITYGGQPAQCGSEVRVTVYADEMRALRLTKTVRQCEEEGWK